LGLKMLSASGIATALLSGASQKWLPAGKEIGISHVLQGAEDKLTFTTACCANSASPKKKPPSWAMICQTCPCCADAALAISVPNAPEIVRSHDTMSRE
jgi:3-deoxy-D-manno-octulosonate 8-phosphate phosphatase (KDO 8-P phosphatase)